MKKFLSTTMFCFVLSCIVLFSACNDIFNSPGNIGSTEKSDKGTVTIVLGAGSARNIYPSIKYGTYEFTFISDGKPDEVIDVTEINSFTHELAEGVYTLAVKTYKGVKNDANFAAEGSSNKFTVTAGETSSINVTLHGIISDEYSGSFSFVIQYPADAELEEFFLEDRDLKSELTDDNKTVSEDFITISKLLENVPTGYHSLSVFFKRADGKEAGFFDVVNIYRNSISEYGTIESPSVFTDNSFFSPYTDTVPVTQYESNGKIFTLAANSTGILHREYQGKKNVLEINPSGWAALSYDISRYGAGALPISISADVWAGSAVKFVWKVNQSGYPAVIANTASANAWKYITGNTTVTISETGRVIYLDNDSANGLNGAKVYIANLLVGLPDDGSDLEIDDSAPLWVSDIQDSVLSAAASYINDNGTMYINYNDGRQIIDGFGGSDAWKRDTEREYYADVITSLYSKTEGIGLTILRNRIPFRERYDEDKASGDYDPNDDFIQVGYDANNKKYYLYDEDENGVKTFTLNWGETNTFLDATRKTITLIKEMEDGPGNDFRMMSTPWTPPNNYDTQWKSGTTRLKPDVGGSLKPAFYKDYADLLADYAKNFEAEMGWPLSVLSIQNEADYATSYESCVWTGDQIRNFLKILGQRFYLKGVQKDLGVMAAEDENFTEKLVISTLNDEKASTMLNYVGVHQYEANTTATNLGAEPLPRSAAAGKRIWQTEMGQSNTGGQIPGGNAINNALAYARMIHYDFTIAEANAWLYWWLWSYDRPDSDHLVAFDDSGLTFEKRYYAIGQFSKFIRPGYQRIGSTANTAANVYTSAYKDPDSKEIVLVLINSGNSSVNVNVSLQNASFASFSGAYRTSATQDLEPLAASFVPVGGSATISNYSLLANSITTLVGTVE